MFDFFLYFQKFKYCWQTKNLIYFKERVERIATFESLKLYNIDT